MGGGLPGPADRSVPHYRPAPEHPFLPGYVPATRPAAMPGYRPMPGERPADCGVRDELAALGRVMVPDCPPAPGYPAVPGDPPAPSKPPPADYPPISDNTISEYPPVVGWPPVPDYPAAPPYLSVRDAVPVPDWPPAAVWRPWALLRRPARLVPPRRATGGTPGRRAAVFGYLTVPVLLVPLVIYLTTLRGSGWARQHAAHAVNVWFTGLLYDLSAVIMGAMLALDSPQVAVIVFAPLVAARWLVTVVYLARAARAASRGAAGTFPAWLCMRIAR